MACSSQTLRDTVIVPWTILYISTRRTILSAARLLYHIVFESYKPFNGQGGSRLMRFTVHAMCPLQHVLRTCNASVELSITVIVFTILRKHRYKPLFSHFFNLASFKPIEPWTYYFLPLSVQWTGIKSAEIFSNGTWHHIQTWQIILLSKETV